MREERVVPGEDLAVHERGCVGEVRERQSGAGQRRRDDRLQHFTQQSVADRPEAHHPNFPTSLPHVPPERRHTAARLRSHPHGLCDLQKRRRDRDLQRAAVGRPEDVPLLRPRLR